MIVNAIDLDAVKAQHKSMWMAGNYAEFSTYLLNGALDFLASCNIPAGAKVLDVACGAGQTAIPMARNGIQVVGVDIASNLIAEARRRAKAAGLPVQFDEGDAEQLPYADEEFDVVFSLIGAMFAPQPERVAAELVRVCRRGGRIIMANWTPGGFVGQMFKTMGKYVPPRPGIPAPTLWGDEDTVRDRLGLYVSDLEMSREIYSFHYPFGVAEVVEYFRTYYGPTNRAFNTLDTSRQAALRNDLEDLWSQHNLSRNGTVQLGAEFLKVQAIRRF